MSGVISTALRHMVEAGMSPEALLAAVVDMEAALDATSALHATEALHRAPLNSTERSRVYRAMQRNATCNVAVASVASPPIPPRDIKNINKITPQTPLSENRFSEFWKIYPRRSARRRAEKDFSRALERCSAEEIIAGAQRYATERCGQDAQYTKTPSAWLNGDCWADDPASKPKLATNGRYAPLAFKKDDAVPDPPTPEERQRRLEILQHLKVKRA